ncbi:MAG: hypothetical protein GY757_59555 [bacterium]|nr:hypothetical protein [bacterium]
MIKRIIPFIITALFLPAFLLSIQTPEEFLGFKPGTDRELAHYKQIKEYFLAMGKESPRIETSLIGKTTLNNDMVMAVISAPENIANLDKYKEISRKLSLAEVDGKQARKLAAKGKAIAFFTCNLHSSEIGSSQMAMVLLHKLATENSPEVMNILNNVIIVLVPSANPDGQAMVVDWYKKTKGTDYEGCNLPYLYHWYAGHDNNRDWFKISLKETWHLTRELYFNFFPQVEVDEHQMGSSGDRFFVPPYADPPSPYVHPLVWRSNTMFGAQIAYDLEKKDYAGVVSGGIFKGWWIGALDDTAWFHNIPGILFEAASVRTASPIYIESEEAHSSISHRNEERIFSPNPWKGGWWRLMDIVNYDLHATLSVLKTAALHREELLNNSYKMAADNIKLGQSSSPYAYVVPTTQWDPMTAEKFVKTLLKSNIKIYKLTEALKTGGQYFEAGSYVVPLAQPYRSFVRNIFAKQRFPDLRMNKNDTPIAPYDGAGWTLHLGMGVDVKTITEPLKGKMNAVTLDSIYKRDFPGTLEEYIILDANYNNSFLAASVLLKKGLPVWRNYTDPDISPGSFVTKKSTALAHLQEINKTMPLVLQSKKDLPLEKYKRLKHFKVALYQNWGHNMVEGWTRFVFDEFKIDYDTIHCKDLLKKDLLKKYDILVFVGAAKSEIESGKPPKKWEKWFAPLPPEYSGGIGEKGKTILKAFLKSGNSIVFMDESCQYALDTFKSPVKNIIKEGSKEVRCPGSYLSVEVKKTDLTFGMPARTALYYYNGPVFKTDLPRGFAQKRNTHVVFGRNDLLISGFLKGDEHLFRRSLVVDFTSHGGRIILLGADVIHRTHTEATYKLMFNSLFTAAIK